MQKPTGKNANILISCADPRVVKWLHHPLVRQKLGLEESYSSISNTGSIKFYLNENLMDKLYKQLDILTGHFSPEKIILLNHRGCGYYKSLNQDEEKFYLADLESASATLSQKYPDLKVGGFLLNTENGELKQI